ncbi:MAG: sulfatase, partial [Planctomycetota bacterium]
MTRTPGIAVGAVGALLTAIAVGLGKVEASGAVPVDEFPPAPAVYATRTWLLAAGLLLVAWALARRIRGPGRAPRISAAGLLLTAAGALLPPLLPAGVLLFVIGAAGERVGHGSGFSPDPPRTRSVLLALVATAALTGTATLLLGLVDSAYHTARFVPRLVTPEQLTAYRLTLPSLAFCFGLQAAPPVVGGLLCVWLLHRGLARVLALRPTAEPLLFSLLLGQAVGAAALLVFRLTLADEMDAIGVTGELAAIGSLLGLALGLHAHANLVRAGSDPAHAGPFELSARLLVLALAPPVARMVRRPVLRTTAIAAGGTGALVVLSLVLYPTVEDFRGEVFDSYAWLTVLLSTLVLIALLPARRAAAVSVALFLAGVVILSLRGQGDATVRLIAHEHSRIGSLAGNSFPARWLDPFPAIGMAPVPGVSYVHHASGEDRLPSLPAPLAERLDRPPIVILVWDAARPDHLSAYGHRRMTTPHLERLAARSVLFRRVYAAATATTASVRDLLAGQYCTRYMLTRRHPPFLLDELAGAGYDRFVITVTGNDFNGVSGEAFERGWDSDREGLKFLRIDAPNEDDFKPDAWKTEEVIRRLRGIHEERGSLAGTFAYVHLTGTHIPWLNEDPVADFGDRPVDLYDGEIAKADRLLGTLMTALESMGEGDRAVVVVTSDHGTGLMEHGRIAGFLPYEEQTRVPLVIRVPGVAPRVVDDVVGLIDVAPTLVGLV